MDPVGQGCGDRIVHWTLYGRADKMRTWEENPT